MFLFAIKRILNAIPILAGISIISFFMVHLAPGDPTSFFADPNVSPVELARIRANLGLDQPIFIQYFKWLFNILKFDFGRSFTTGEPVLTEIVGRLPNTLLLSISSLIITISIAIPLGVMSAIKKGFATGRGSTTEGGRVSSTLKNVVTELLMLPAVSLAK